MNASHFRKKIYKFLELSVDVIAIIVGFDFVTLFGQISKNAGILDSIQIFFSIVTDDLIDSPIKFIGNNISLSLQNITTVFTYIIISRIFKTSLVEKNILELWFQSL